jgi:hypothetical protein
LLVLPHKFVERLGERFRLHLLGHLADSPYQILGLWFLLILGVKHPKSLFESVCKFEITTPHPSYREQFNVLYEHLLNELVLKREESFAVNLLKMSGRNLRQQILQEVQPNEPLLGGV